MALSDSLKGDRDADVNVRNLTVVREEWLRPRVMEITILACCKC